VDGRLGLDLGVYGAPETYIIDAGGVIRGKHVGVIDDAVWQQAIKPLLKQLQGATP
jgi:cytochrome c biogenesis protein CcmG/thiol:disulfide interchange protein DsbE